MVPERCFVKSQGCYILKPNELIITNVLYFYFRNVSWIIKNLKCFQNNDVKSNFISVCIQLKGTKYLLYIELVIL